MIIGIAGKKGSGKDTVANHLVENHGFVKFAFADALKKVALKSIHTIWPDQLGHITLDDMYSMSAKEIIYDDVLYNREPFSIRKFLQHFGTSIIRDNLGENVWVDVILKKIQHIIKHNPQANICISDCRFDNEVNALRAFSKHTNILIYIIRVERNLVDNTETCKHVSENQAFDVDFIISNNCTLHELFNNVNEYVYSFFHLKHARKCISN